ncbi:hypothetical protein JCM11251_007882 [Rhodosporidiobolus azoricus]
MPVPPLPLEVVSLIAEEVRLSYTSEKDLRADGTSVSLVCRAWQPLGERIAWYTLVLDSSRKAHWANERFIDNVRLATTVRAIAVPRELPAREKQKTSDSSQMAEWEEPGSAEANVSDILEVCELSEVLLLEEPPWLDLEVVLSLFPPLPRLLAFHFETRIQGFAQGPRFLHALSTMSRLYRLTLRMPDNIDYSENTSSPTSPLTLLPLEQALLRCNRWTVNQPGSPRYRLTRDLLPLINPSTLRSLELNLDCDQLPLIDSAFSFPVLDKITFIFQRGDPQAAFDYALHHVKRYSRRVQITLGACNLDGRSRPIKLFGSDELGTILDALPEHAAFLGVGGMHVNALALPPLLPNGHEFSASNALSVAVKVGDGEEEPKMCCFGKSAGAWYTAEI